MSALPLANMRRVAARNFKVGDVVRFNRCKGDHSGARGYRRLRIVANLGRVNRYGSPLFTVEDMDGGAISEQGFVSQLMYIVEAENR